MTTGKVCATPEEAVADISDGAIVAMGGFSSHNIPIVLLRALMDRGVRDLTLCGNSGWLLEWEADVERMVCNGHLRKVIDAFPFWKSTSRVMRCPFAQAVRDGKIEVEVYPMGTLTEKYRAAAAGILGFYTPTGAGTILTQGKETRVFDGIEAVLETPLRPDFGLVHATAGDTDGNLYYRKTAAGFNPVVAAASRLTIAEVENLVQPGELDPEKVRTPGVYVRRLVQVHALRPASESTGRYPL